MEIIGACVIAAIIVACVLASWAAEDKSRIAERNRKQREKIARRL